MLNTPPLKEVSFQMIFLGFISLPYFYPSSSDVVKIIMGSLLVIMLLLYAFSGPMIKKMSDDRLKESLMRLTMVAYQSTKTLLYQMAFYAICLMTVYVAMGEVMTLLYALVTNLYGKQLGMMFAEASTRKAK